LNEEVRAVKEKRRELSRQEKEAKLVVACEKLAWFLDYVADPVGDVAQAGALTFGPLVIPFAMLDTAQSMCGILIIPASLFAGVPLKKVFWMPIRLFVDWLLGSLGLVPLWGWLSIPFDFLFRPNMKNAAVLAAHVAAKYKPAIAE
jgi:hypothetical protein